MKPVWQRSPASLPNTAIIGSNQFPANHNQHSTLELSTNIREVAVPACLQIA